MEGLFILAAVVETAGFALALAFDLPLLWIMLCLFFVAASLLRNLPKTGKSLGFLLPEILGLYILCIFGLKIWLMWSGPVKAEGVLGLVENILLGPAFYFCLRSFFGPLPGMCGLAFLFVTLCVSGVSPVQPNGFIFLFLSLYFLGKIFSRVSVPRRSLSFFAGLCFFGILFSAAFFPPWSSNTAKSLSGIAKNTALVMIKPAATETAVTRPTVIPVVKKAAAPKKNVPKKKYEAKQSHSAYEIPEGLKSYTGLLLSFQDSAGKTLLQKTVLQLDMQWLEALPNLKEGKVLWKGYLYVPQGGSFLFCLQTNQSGKLMIDEQKILSKTGHAAGQITGRAMLKAGIHDLVIQVHVSRPATLSVLWGSSSGDLEGLTTPYLYHPQTAKP